MNLTQKLVACSGGKKMDMEGNPDEKHGYRSGMWISAEDADVLLSAVWLSQHMEALQDRLYSIEHVAGEWIFTVSKGQAEFKSVLLRVAAAEAAAYVSACDFPKSSVSESPREIQIELPGIEANPCLPVEELEQLREVMHYLDSSVENAECYCEDKEKCTIENPQCNAMEVRRAVKVLEGVLTPPLGSSQPARLLTGYAERVFFEEFARYNQRSPGINGGYTTLELLLSTDTGKRNFMGLPCNYNPPVSRRDAFVAGSIIQWLGTSCGLSFIRRCEMRIEKERMVNNELGGHLARCHPTSVPEESLESQYGRHIAGEYFTPDDSRYVLLANRIASAIVKSRKIMDSQISG